ncbi:hypothetical protein NL676_036325 [Syzygium grande]|nr:hypothetical protein NL676_036325 [Syzygium grande]
MIPRCDDPGFFESNEPPSAEAKEVKVYSLIVNRKKCREKKLCLLLRPLHRLLALCSEHNVSLINVPSAKSLGEWAGLCKIDSEGKARKVVGCSCVVLKDFGEETEARHVVLEYVKSH